MTLLKRIFYLFSVLGCVNTVFASEIFSKVVGEESWEKRQLSTRKSKALRSLEVVGGLAVEMARDDIKVPLGQRQQAILERIYDVKDGESLSFLELLGVLKNLQLTLSSTLCTRGGAFLVSNEFPVAVLSAVQDWSGWEWVELSYPRILKAPSAVRHWRYKEWVHRIHHSLYSVLAVPSVMQNWDGEEWERAGYPSLYTTLPPLQYSQEFEEEVRAYQEKGKADLEAFRECVGWGWRCLDAMLTPASVLKKLKASDSSSEEAFSQKDWHLIQQYVYKAA